MKTGAAFSFAASSCFAFLMLSRKASSRVMMPASPLCSSISSCRKGLPSMIFLKKWVMNESGPHPKLVI